MIQARLQSKISWKPLKSTKLSWTVGWTMPVKGGFQIGALGILVWMLGFVLLLHHETKKVFCTWSDAFVHVWLTWKLRSIKAVVVRIRIGQNKLPRRSRASGQFQLRGCSQLGVCLRSTHRCQFVGLTALSERYQLHRMNVFNLQQFLCLKLTNGNGWPHDA